MFSGIADLDIRGSFTKQLKSVVEGGELKSNIYSNGLHSLHTNFPTNGGFSLNFSDYQLQKNYYTKNLKNTLKGVDSINPQGVNDFWSLPQSNNVIRVFPNLNKVLLAGNLLISSKESEGSFNTNLVSIKNPEWSALDRYFLSFSRKNTQDTYRFVSDIESLFLGKKSRQIFSKDLFFKNSDHSDSNRYLKRGWGLSEPMRLIKLSFYKALE